MRLDFAHPIEEVVQRSKYSCHSTASRADPFSPLQNFTESKLLFEPAVNGQSLCKQAQRFLQPFVSTPIARQADHKV